ncbi:hypothetical protein [Nocardia puris]
MGWRSPGLTSSSQSPDGGAAAQVVGLRRLPAEVAGTTLVDVVG